MNRWNIFNVIIILNSIYLAIFHPWIVAQPWPVTLSTSMAAGVSFAYAVIQMQQWRDVAKLRKNLE